LFVKYFVKINYFEGNDRLGMQTKSTKNEILKNLNIQKKVSNLGEFPELYL
jgi:hypothetical protein